MVRTRVGYAGGTMENPTYQNLGDHTEAIQIDFDPKKISFAQLLDIFWNAHDPCAKSWSTQYMSAVFVANDGQRRVAEETRDALGKGRAIRTPILEATKFTNAEDYHQKYRLQNVQLMRELAPRFDEFSEFVNSTAAARLNGFLAGYGSKEALEKGWSQLGISEATAQALLKRMR